MGNLDARVLSGGEGVLIDDDQAVARILAHAVEESSTASCFQERRKTMAPPPREISAEGVCLGWAETGLACWAAEVGCGGQVW
jgi:hypothetical protein